ncbi:VWA domain-containing protein [Paenibacillus harenae]|uniref:Mg-chelatase subunit ChlD n=1 Tax=Paenibacillus harenae TaxID=306543 RepID=A0ABT9UAM1_PAEHA|nr:VWA domain-containing protein [Paenibacillus harenae]MDQ0116677.1 Mg-chelatase subunit ChlD [Paenibacillus harenae]
MGIQVEAPWALTLLLPWLFYMAWIIRTTIRLKGGRKIAAITLRGIITVLLIAIVAQVQPFVIERQRSVVIVADRSASMQADKQIGEWIAKGWAARHDGDTAGVVSTGLNAAVERSISNELTEESASFAFRTTVNDRFTDLSGGLQLAAAMLQKEGGGRVVLLSDGAENAGDARRQARLLANAGIAVDVVEMQTEPKSDAAIESLDVPAMLKQGETFPFEIAIASVASQQAELRLFADNEEISVTQVQLEKGDNRFVLNSIAVEPGYHRFRAELYAAGDEQAANNTAYAFSRVAGPPHVLIVEGQPQSSANVEAALSASFIGHTTIMPEQLSVELAEYASYDSIILNNVPATRIAEKPMEWLGKAVSDYGVGLVMLGGEDSFGLGGYFKTPVERALPVYMDLQGKRQIPSLGLVLVIDRSGSMSDGKLELAKEAAIRTIELMRDADTVGVVAFDSAPWWVVEPEKLSNRDSIIERIQGIQSEGGTEIYNALKAGYEGLLEVDAQRKHMILLTDGQSATNPGYEALTDAIVDDQMTLSTVAVGDGADQVLLERLAKAAKGRFYFTKDQSTLPAIFSRETVMMSRTYIVEQNFTPAIAQASDWSKLWSGGVPTVNAYIAATAKEAAEVALLTPNGDPLLARWQYGSGRSVAWTTDVTGKWAREWVQWPSFPNVLTEWVKWTFPQFANNPYSITTEQDGGQATLKVRSEAGAGSFGSALSAGIEDESGSYTIRRLMPTGPGEYETSLQATEPGVYLTQIGRQAVGNAIEGGTTSAFVIPYSPEYRLSNTDGAETMAQIAATTGGRKLLMDNPQALFQFEPLEARRTVDITNKLLLAILLLWLADIALRRLSLPYGRLLEWAGKIFKLRNGRRSGQALDASASASAVTRLRKRASEASRFYGGNDTESAAHQTNAAQKENAANPVKPAATSSASHSSASTGHAVVDRSGRAEQDPAADGTINRLLAAKNKNRR